MTTPLLVPVLRYAFLAGLLLFVVRVLRAVLVDLDVRAVPASPSRTVLVVERPEALRGREFLVAGEAMIGRAPECSIMLADDYVSAHHARAFRRGGRVWVEDLRSTNGTLLNGRRLRRPAELRAGDRLKIGEVVLGFRVEPPAPVPPPGAPSRAADPFAAAPGRGRLAAPAGPDTLARAPGRRAGSPGGGSGETAGPSTGEDAHR